MLVAFGICTSLDGVNSRVDIFLGVRMRRNNPLDMSVVEQLIVIREEVCDYACKYREKAKKENDDILWKVDLQKYCRECPLAKLHWKSE